MPLTPGERQFLAHFAHEYTNITRGPATEALAPFRLTYLPDYHWLLESYIGHLWRLGLFDGCVPAPEGPTPPLPWQSADEVRRRNRELEPEVLALRERE